jgi:hypothetical protein
MHRKTMRPFRPISYLFLGGVIAAEFVLNPSIRTLLSVVGGVLALAIAGTWA